jgi:pimeloyl-ACP methyl ester carboxylesterase
MPGKRLCGASGPGLLRLLTLVLAAATAGCGTWTTVSAALEEEQDASSRMTAETMVVSQPPVKSEDAAAGARQFALMALLSQLSYLRHLPESERNDADCGQWIRGHPINRIDTRDPGKTPAWRRWGDERGCFSGSGLYYEVYVFQKEGPGEHASQAVIAFRGTENYGTQSLLDWSSNASSALGVHAIEYEQAQRQVPRTIQALRDQHPGVQIFLTGHSLGGGLAQQSAYMAREGEVAATYVFNTSAVTNWSALQREGKIGDGSHDPRIYRVQERGEGLGLLRWVSSRVNFRRYGRSDHEFNFSQGNLASEHNMAILTCNFAVRVLNTGADFGYTAGMARQVLQYQPDAAPPKGKGVIPPCPGKVLEKLPPGLWPDRSAG